MKLGLIPVMMAVAFGSVLSATAQVPAAKTAVDSSCAVDNGAFYEAKNQAKASAQIAQRGLAFVDQGLKLVESLPDGKPEASIGELMNADQANQFGNLQERMRSATLAELIESKRERDIRIFSRMAEIANNMSKVNYEFPQDNNAEESVLTYSILALREDEFGLKNIAEKKITDFVYNNVCNLEYSILNLSKNEMEKSKLIYGLLPAINDLNELITKYKTPLEKNKLSVRDAEKLELIIPVITQFDSKTELSRDLFRIAQLEQISKLMLDSRRADAYVAPGDVAYMGTDWNERVKSGKVTSEQNKLTAFLNYLNDKIPAQAVVDSDEAEKAGAMLVPKSNK